VLPFISRQSSRGVPSSRTAPYDYMKANADTIAPEGMRRIEGGTLRFFHKGTNKRWRDILTTEDLQRYEEVVARNLTPDCTHWLETGVMVD
jgi:aryl sulfotransferase